MVHTECLHIDNHNAIVRERNKQIDILKTDLKDAIDQYAHDNQIWIKEIDALKRENKSLKEALTIEQGEFIRLRDFVQKYAGAAYAEFLDGDKTKVGE